MARGASRPSARRARSRKARTRAEPQEAQGPRPARRRRNVGDPPPSSPLKSTLSVSGRAARARRDRLEARALRRRTPRCRGRAPRRRFRPVVGETRPRAPRPARESAASKCAGSGFAAPISNESARKGIRPGSSGATGGPRPNEARSYSRRARESRRARVREAREGAAGTDGKCRATPASKRRRRGAGGLPRARRRGRRPGRQAPEVELLLEPSEEMGAKDLGGDAGGFLYPEERDRVIKADEDVSEVDEKRSQRAALRDERAVRSGGRDRRF